MVLKGNPTGPYGPDHPRRIAEASMAVFPITNFPDPSYTAVPVSIPVPIVSGVVADPEELLTLGPAWDAITQRFLSPMQQSDWLLSCMHAFPHRGTPHMLVDAVDGKLCGVAPLIIDRLTWPPRATQLGVADLHEPTELVFAVRRGWTAWWSGWLTCACRFDWNGCPRTRRRSRHCAGLSRATDWSLSDHVRPFHSSLCPRHGKIRRDNCRRVAGVTSAVRGNGPLPLVKSLAMCLRPRPSELDELFDAALQIEARGWKGKAKTALLHDPLRFTLFPAITSAPPAIVERFACAGCDSATRPWPCSLPLKRPGGFGC